MRFNLIFCFTEIMENDFFWKFSELFSFILERNFSANFFFIFCIAYFLVFYSPFYFLVIYMKQQKILPVFRQWAFFFAQFLRFVYFQYILLLIAQISTEILLAMFAITNRDNVQIAFHSGYNRCYEILWQNYDNL